MNRYKKVKGLGAAALILGGVLVLLLVAGIGLAGSYNNLVAQDTLVQQRAADIDSQLKRRADLVPNLVATVKGYAKHESDVYENIANARARLLSSDVNQNPQEAAAANQAFNTSLGRLLALAENYPQLKADQNFIRLQDELTGTENRINYARVNYNDAVRTYNLKVRSFPTNTVAGLFGFAPRQSFEATAAERETPKVQF